MGSPAQKNNLSDIAKKAAGEAAAELVEDGMLIGLGTGSTAAFFIRKLGQRCREGLKVRAVATSKNSHEAALKGGIPLADIERLTALDLDIDGADEIDPQKRMIKGGGGALVREKIVAGISKEMIVIVDEGKLVERLGKFPLPVEILPFASAATIDKINRLGFRGGLRINAQQGPYITDNGNYIYDVHFSEPPQNPEKVHAEIRSLPGVVDTGFFFNLAGRVIVGFQDGSVEIR